MSSVTISGDAAFRADLYGLRRRVGLVAPLLHEYLQYHHQLQLLPSPRGSSISLLAGAGPGAGANEKLKRGETRQRIQGKRKPRKDEGSASDSDPSGAYGCGYAEQLQQLRQLREGYRETHRLQLRSLRSAAQTISEERWATDTYGGYRHISSLTSCTFT
jgi:hypothetical protein